MEALLLVLYMFIAILLTLISIVFSDFKGNIILSIFITIVLADLAGDNFSNILNDTLAFNLFLVLPIVIIITFFILLEESYGIWLFRIFALVNVTLLVSLFILP